jgi:hypothetical protein
VTTVVLAATQQALEQLEAGGVVVDGEHAHADGELVLPPVPARPPQRPRRLLHGHLLAHPNGNGEGIEKRRTRSRIAGRPRDALLLLANGASWILNSRTRRGKAGKVTEHCGREERRGEEGSDANSIIGEEGGRERD